MDRMTDEHAAALLDRIDSLTEKLNVAEQLTRRLRVATYVLAVLVALMGAVILGLAETADDAHDAADDASAAVAGVTAQAVTNCESGNLRLEGQRQIWHAYFEVTAAAAVAQDSPQAVLDYYAEFEDWIKTEVLPDRDCDNLDQPIAEPGPPPSFQRALEEALRDQQDKPN